MKPNFSPPTASLAPRGAVQAPPLLLGAALLFWGWQANFLIAALVMALVLESAHLIKSRWEFSDAEFSRIWMLSTFLFVGLALYIYSADDIAAPLFKFVQWYPIPFFPMLAAVAFSNRDGLSLRTISWFFARGKGSEAGNRVVNLSYPYFAICLIAASATASRGTHYYVGLAALIGWALFPWRPRRVSMATWIFLLLLVAGGGFISHVKLHQLQDLVEATVGDWLGRARGIVSPKEARTSIGDIARIKLSGRIVIRVEPVEGHPHPETLREASYDVYRNGTWSASEGDLRSLTANADDSWMLGPRQWVSHSARIATYLKGGEGILPLPHGTFEINDLPAVMFTNTMGVVKVEGGPGLARYLASFGASAWMDAAPGELDEEIPEIEKPALAQIAEQLNLESLSVDERILAIRRFFLDQFEYSTFLQAPPRSERRSRRRSALNYFLTETRSGHCEYFATATVLLLREAKIPARYVTGYAVEERARDNKTYLVRERHAHAWCLVYRNGAWETLDTTPPSWSAIENDHASFFEPLSDFKSWLWYQFSRWRWSKTSYRHYLVALLIPLSATLVWRIVFNQQRRRFRTDAPALPPARVWPGLDSELYALEARLAAMGLVRLSGEPVLPWCRRVEAFAVAPRDALRRLVSLHNRYRFDPDGLSAAEREELAAAASAILREVETRESSSPA